MLREIQPWLVVGLTYISFIDEHSLCLFVQKNELPGDQIITIRYCL
jgi:hypothetical protein